MDNGYFVRWGKTPEDDPDFSPVGPELLDIEISTICSKGCAHCYKSNTCEGKYMKLKTFKKLFKGFPKNLTQIAFGVGDIDGNPDLWKIMEHTRKNGVIPNITINGHKFTSSQADQLANICGAVAVSHYDDESCFNAVHLLKEAGLEQVNIHKLVAMETLQSCMDLFGKVDTEPRLKGLNAIVLLGLKRKGRGKEFHTLDYDNFKTLVDYGMNLDIPLGFDSCSAHKFLKAIEGREDYDMIEQLVEPCESSCFSYYINVDGNGFPCSFLEEGFGINLLKSKDFMKDLWYSPSVMNFRSSLIDNDRECLRYDI
jgi:hypothetical protein